MAQTSNAMQQNFNGCYVNLSQTTSHRITASADEEINFIDENKEEEFQHEQRRQEANKANDLGDEGEHSSTVYNFPWDFKLGNKPLMLQTQLSNVPNAHSTVLDSSGGGGGKGAKPNELTVGQDEQDENQYCAPWDLKLQENMLKLMASGQQQQPESSVLNENHSSVNKKPDFEQQTKLSKQAPISSDKLKEDEQPAAKMSTVEEESSEYSLPWEHKQPFLMQRLNKEAENTESLSLKVAAAAANNGKNQQSQVKSGKSAEDSDLATKNTEKFSRNNSNRLSCRSNHSNSSSAHSSSSSLSINSPPLLTNAANQPILLPQTFTSTLNDQATGAGSNAQASHCLLPSNVHLISPTFTGETHCKCGHSTQKQGFNQTQHVLISSQTSSNNGQISSVLVPVNMANNLLNGMNIISATPGTASNKTSLSNLSFATAGSLTPMNSGSCLNDTSMNKTWKTTNSMFDPTTTSSGKIPSYPCSSTQLGYPSSTFAPAVNGMVPNQFGTGISLISNDMKMAFPTGTILLSTNTHNHLGLLQSQNSSNNLFTLNHPQCHLLAGASSMGTVGGWNLSPSLDDQV